MAEIALTPTSYIVLGLLELAGQATPYEMKQAVTQSIGNFWSVPHSQLYAEPERLARGGYVTVERERSGRRRKRYTPTDRGRQALRDWLAASTEELPELRDNALLKIFFGADPALFAHARLEAHSRKLESYEALRDRAAPGTPTGPLRALEAGIGHEREWVRYWSELAKDVS